MSDLGNRDGRQTLSEEAPHQGRTAPPFEQTAKELGCDDGQALDAAFGKIVPPKVAKVAKVEGS